VGPSGHIYGVDLSAVMLATARKELARQGLENVTLVQRDAANYTAPEPLDAVIFGFSYNTMPHHLSVLQQALAQLRPGGRVVIMDAKLPNGWMGKLITPFAIWLMRQTLLGNPLMRPWEHLAAVTDNCNMREFLLSSYYICRGTKPVRMPRAA